MEQPKITYPLGFWTVARRDEYLDEDGDVMTAVHLVQGESSMVRTMTENDLASWDEKGVSLSTGSTVTLAIIHEPGA